MRSFFVGNSVTFVDILLCCQLDRLFRLIICEEMRKNIVHLIRWYSYVRNLKPFVDCIGEMVLCEE
jgi:glutathione S-transferase